MDNLYHTAISPTQQIKLQSQTILGFHKPQGVHTVIYSKFYSSQSRGNINYLLRHDPANRQHSITAYHPRLPVVFPLTSLSFRHTLRLHQPEYVALFVPAVTNNVPFQGPVLLTGHALHEEGELVVPPHVVRLQLADTHFLETLGYPVQDLCSLHPVIVVFRGPGGCGHAAGCHVPVVEGHVFRGLPGVNLVLFNVSGRPGTFFAAGQGTLTIVPGHLKNGLVQLWC